MPNLEELKLPFSTNYRENTIEEITKQTKLKKVLINPYNNCDINFQKLEELEELTITSQNPYNIAIWFNTDEYNYLKNNNVKIFFIEDIEEKYLKTANQLDQIIKELPINENSTDEEILNVVLEYVIKNFNSDPKAELNEHAYMLHKHYYEGILYGAFECDTQISGNYAAMIEAIYDRLREPRKSYILENKSEYKWNLIQIDGKDYYIDGMNLDLKKKDEEGNLIGKQQVGVYSEKSNDQYIAINIPNDSYEITNLVEKKYSAMTKSKEVEIPYLDMQPLQISIQQLDTEINKKIKEHNKNITTSAIAGIIELTIALYTLLKRKYKNQIREIKEYIKHL